MITSAFLHNAILRKQNQYERTYFEEQAHLSFDRSGSSWLDCLFHPWPSGHQRTTPYAVLGANAAADADTCSTAGGTSSGASVAIKVTAAADLHKALCNADARHSMFFIRQKNPRTRLSISRDLFDALCDYCDIFEKIHEYVLCFGIKSTDIQMSPPASQFYFMSNVNVSVACAQVRAFELSYIIRFVEPDRRPDIIPWSLQQAGIYHKFSGHEKPSTWMFIALSSSLEKQLHQYLDATKEDLELNPFEIHVLIFDSAVAGWKGCLSYLDAEVQKQSDRFFMVQFELKDFAATRIEERQYIKKIEDLIIDVVTALSFMLESMDALIVFYRSSKQRSQHEEHLTSSKAKPEVDPDILLAGLQQRRRDLVVSHAHAEALQRKAQSVSELISNILDLDNGNALKLLAIETRLENANMAVMTKRSVQDAATVKVLTVVTLVYLPLTVVTNFFSTSFVNTNGSANGSLSITITQDVWILFAVGVPLTILTIYIWWVFAQKEVKGRYPGFWDSLAQETKLFGSRILSSNRRTKKGHDGIEHVVQQP